MQTYDCFQQKPVLSQFLTASEILYLNGYPSEKLPWDNLDDNEIFSARRDTENLVDKDRKKIDLPTKKIESVKHGREVQVIRLSKMIFRSN